MSALVPAIPEPATSTLPALLSACEAVTTWADQCEDVGEVREVYDRFAAIAEYLSRRDAAQEANATLRKLEVRIGQLLGPAVNGGDRRSDQIPHAVTGLPANRAHEFRSMAAYPEVVDEVIEESTEDSPASRRKVLDAIRNLEDVAKEETVRNGEPRRNPLKDQTDRAGWELRKAVEKLERLFDDDRFRANREAISLGLHANLEFATLTCDALLDQLENR